MVRQPAKGLPRDSNNPKAIKHLLPPNRKNLSKLRCQAPIPNNKSHNYPGMSNLTPKNKPIQSGNLV